MATYTKTATGWRVQQMVDGVRLSKNFPSKGECRAWIENEVYRVRHGRAKYDDGHTFKDALIRYRDTVSDKKKGSRWESLRVALLIREQPELVEKPISRVTPNDLAQYRDFRLKSVMGSTVRREFTLYNSVFNVAIREWGWLEFNPLTRVERPPASLPRQQRITPDIEADIVSTLKRGPASHQTASVLFLLALECAARLGELCGITPADIKAKYVRVDGKTGPRDVPLTPKGRKLVRELMECEPVNPAQASKILSLVGKPHGVVFHDTRHEACHRLAEKLPNVLDLCKITGHTKPDLLLRVYYHPSADDLADKLV